MSPAPQPEGAPPGPALFPTGLAQGFSLILNQAQMGAQALINQQAQTAQMVSKSVQQAQVNFLNTLNQMLLGPAAQAARPPLVPLQSFIQGGEGVYPMAPGFFPENTPQAVQEKTEKQVPYYPLTEGERDFTKGGFTQSPQQEFPQPAPPDRQQKTEFF